MLDALKCALDVAAGVRRRFGPGPWFPGNIGARAARQLFSLRDEQVIEVGNAWATYSIC